MSSRRASRIRGLRKVPIEAKKLHRATETILVFTEAKVEDRTSRSIYWNLTLDLRDLRTELETRYPVLGPAKTRPRKIGEESS